MTHFEAMMFGKKNLAEVLCRRLDCGYCPAWPLCRAGDNGMERWLDLEDSEDDEWDWGMEEVEAVKKRFCDHIDEMVSRAKGEFEKKEDK